ncbi:MAG: glycosyltransferase family 4 protein [Alphaproteobacteria bacterium]|nr:glycosyltransferase family 4 protein [Alphaproteobacteria bacterium]
MRCLWLTLADPDPPLDGQLVYSGGLVRAFADTGAKVTVIGLRSEKGTARTGCEGNIRWQIPDSRQRPRWTSLTSALPHMASRCDTPAMRKTLDRMLQTNSWDAIVFDSISAGWALPAIRRHYAGAARRPRQIYLSHNHEVSLRRALASNRSNPLMRQAQWLDAWKTRKLEHELIESSDLVTAITLQDRELYRAEWPDKPIEVLSPGYSGRQLAERTITADVPRRAVLVGSFDWAAKRMNLEEFLAVADPIFAAHGIELQVVGAGDRDYFQRLESGLSATRFTGTVERVEKFIDDARIAVLPERIGGGFKLKLLEYVFNRIPVLGLKGSIAGTPLEDKSSVLLFSSQSELASGVSRMIDNLGRLNQLQDAAYAACRNAFDWASRGAKLASAMEAI